MTPAINPRIMMIDNYDSFTYNLVHYLQQFGCDMVVRRNDEITIAEIEALKPTHLVISPGPCDPNKAGISLQVLEAFHEKLPILGVCLGHQAIGQFFGAKVVKAEQVLHGKTSKIYHKNKGLYALLPQGFSATRYHSLVIDSASIPNSLEITAWTESDDGQQEYIMGIRHKYLPIFGMQYHPESVLSEYGLLLLHRFVQIG